MPPPPSPSRVEKESLKPPFFEHSLPSGVLCVICEHAPRRSVRPAVNAMSSPPLRRKGPPPTTSTPDDAQAELDRLARNRADSDHRPIMRPDAEAPAPHVETSPAFRAIQLTAAVERAEAEVVAAQDAVRVAKAKRGKKGKRTAGEIAAKAVLAAASEEVKRLRADLNVEQAGGERARLAALEAQGRIMQAERDDPDDSNTTGQRKAKQVTGPRTACRIRMILARGKHGGLFDEAHVVGADRLRLDYDISRYGFSPDPDAPRSRRSGPRLSPSEGEYEQAYAARRFARAIQAVGLIADGLLRAVVLDGLTVDAWCDMQGERTGTRPNNQAATGLLAGALSALVRHYEGESGWRPWTG